MTLYGFYENTTLMATLQNILKEQFLSKPIFISFVFQKYIFKDFSNLYVASYIVQLVTSIVQYKSISL